MGRQLRRIETMLAEALGQALVERCPGLVYGVSEIISRFRTTPDTLDTLLRAMDSLLFNAVYVGTERKMTVPDGQSRSRRVTSGEIRELADRLLSLAYEKLPVSPSLQDDLFDFSRQSGSFAAMRALLDRFPLDEMERMMIERVLEENGQGE